MRTERRHPQAAPPPFPRASRRGGRIAFSGHDRRVPDLPVARESLADRLLRELLECERRSGD